MHIADFRALDAQPAAPRPAGTRPPTFLGKATRWLAAAALLSGCLASSPALAVDYRVLGQPTLTSEAFSSRCTGTNQRFGGLLGGGKGPAGITVDADGRLFATDFGGKRVLMWATVDALASCQGATVVASSLGGPEAVVFDPSSKILFVADTLRHVVIGYKQFGRGWSQQFVLGASGASGNAMNRFYFPRGLAVDSGGRLFVADDFNHRVLIFDPAFVSGESAVDSISAGSNGGFQNPKALAMVGHTLFVADYNKDRVLRFTGPFKTPSQVYVASGSFTGVSKPVDLAVHADGSLLVTDQGNLRIARYVDAAFSGNKTAPSSSFAEHLNVEPLGVASDRKGRIYIADFSAYRVLIRDEFVRTTPVDSAATTKAKSLLADLHARPGKAVDRVAIGQQLIDYKYTSSADTTGWNASWLKMQSLGYPLPVIMGGELSNYLSYTNFAPNANARTKLIAHGQAGHMVTLVWHPANPVSAGSDKPISTAQLQSLINDSTTAGQAWQVQLDRAAAALKSFSDAGVPVLFRPLHEQNGDFFWWGHDASSGSALRERQAAWVAMWRDMVNELTVKKGLHNLVFVFGTNQVNYDGVAPPLTYYPGAGHADVVGIDVYDEELDMAGPSRGLQHYAALIGTGKPFGFPEFGQTQASSTGTGTDGQLWDARTLTTRIIDSYPRTAFAVAWYSSTQGSTNFVFAIPDVSYGKEMMQHALIQTQ